MSFAIPPEEASDHLALLRKLHGSMVADNNTEGETEIMELLEFFKSPIVNELTDPGKIAARNEAPGPNISDLFEVEGEGEYPDNFQAQLHAEAKDWEVYRVRLDKSMDRPLGFSIIGKSEAGVIVKEIFPGTAAALDGSISSNDRVLAIGNKMLGDTPFAHKEAVTLLKESKGSVELWMARPPRTAGPKPTEPYWRHLEAIELLRHTPEDDIGITVGQGAREHEAVVMAMAVGGIAEKDGRLQVGDRILEVQRRNVTRVSVEQISESINAPAPVLRLKIARMIPGQDPMANVLGEDQYETLTIKLIKGDKGLGLTIAAYVGSGDSRGIFVKEVVPGTSAASQDVQGLDQIIEVDGHSLVGLENPQALKILKATGGETMLTLRRRLHKKDNSEELPDAESEEDILAKWQPRVLPWETVLVFDVRKDANGGLGMGVEGRGQEGQPDPTQQHHIVCSINPDGAVGRAGILQSGDRLLQLDKTDLTEKDHEETVDSLREAPSCFRLAVARADKAAATAAAAAGEIPSEAPEKEAVRVKSPVKAWEEQREVTLTKEAHGRLGFSILDYEHPDNKDEIIVLIRVVVENSAAYGVLRQNQRLYHVNGTKVDGKSMQNAILVLKAQSIGSVCLGIADPVASHSEPSSVVETTNSQNISVRCSYGEMDLGIDIDVERGREGVLIKTLLKNGSIAKDGRLAVGDRLLAVNGIKLDHKSPALARAALHNASKCDVQMKLTYEPGPRHGVAMGTSGMSDSPAKSGVSQASIKSGTSSSRLPSLSAYSEPITVNVPRMPSGGVGISIVGGNTELEEADGSVTRIHGIFIKHVLPDSPAGASGQLKSGDRVLEVSGTSLENSSHQQAVAAIRNAGDPVTLVIQSLPATMRESRKDRMKREEKERQEAGSKDHSPERTALLVAAKKKYGDKFEEFDLHVVKLVKGDQGLGLGLGSSHGRIVVGDVRTASPAVGKLNIGDIFVEVNGTSILDMSHSDASNFLRLAPAELTCVVARPRAITPKPSPSVKHAAVADLKLTKDELREVVLVKPATGGLGMSISKHRMDEKILFIKSVTPGSVASENPRIRRGDHVLQINGVTTKDLDYSQAITMLKEAKGEVTMVLGTLPPGLLSSPPTSPSPTSSMNLQIVELVKPATGGLGISIVERVNPTKEGKRAIFIADVVMDGVAYKDGRLKANSRIMSVNGQDMSEAVQAEAVKALKAASGKVVLAVQPPDSSSGDSSAASKAKAVAGSSKPKMGAVRATGFSMTLDQTRSPPSSSFDTGNDDDEPHRVVIDRQPGQSLGMSIAGGIGSVTGDVPIFIASVQPEGLAASTKSIHVGDRILEVNEQKVLGMKREDVLNILRSSTNQVVLLVVRDNPISSLNTKKTSVAIAKQERRENEYRTVKLQKSERGYGFSIVGGLDETGADFPLYVKEVVPGSVADESGELHRGDQLVAINGQKLEGLSCKAASQIIFDSTSEELALTLLSLLSE